MKAVVENININLTARITFHLDLTLNHHKIHIKYDLN